MAVDPTQYQTVPGCGPANAQHWIIGEAPGESEAAQGRPFVGRSGTEQRRYLSLSGMSDHTFWRNNVVQSYIPGNPDPTPALIEYWTPRLQRELDQRKPTHIIAVGRFAVRWFLGDVDMDAVHGIPQRSARTSAIILPCFHPAFGFYDDEARALIAYDYRRACAVIQGKLPAHTPTDELAGTAQYLDITGTSIARLLRGYLLTTPSAPIAIDTEGVPSAPWSIQVSLRAGTGYCLRVAQPDFSTGIAAIATYIGSVARPTVVLHNAMYDLEMCREMGLDLFDCALADTRYAAYIMRVEPQGLKALAPRWCGMRMQSYEDVVGPAGLEKQLDYIGRILDVDDWTVPEPRIEYSNDGTSKLYTPQPVTRRAEAILVDFWSGKLDNKGNRTDPYARWHKVDRDLRKEVEARFGPMPVGTLDDIPLGDACYYAARDPDATLRVYNALVPALAAQGLSDLMSDGMEVLPVFEQMQYNGMPFDRGYCAAKSEEMWQYMLKVGHRISHRYYGGAPFNPASSDQVAALMRRRGLTGEKRSKKTGKVSTAKKSIEHLRHTDDAMADVIDWREHQKMRDAFYEPIVERIDDTGVELIRTHINPYKVTSRRISSSNPNLTAIPVRNDLGVEVRDGAVAPAGYVFGSWDLSQVEMRYMAHISGDILMKKFFNSKNPVTGKDYDMHAETASRIFNISLDQVDEMKHRYPSKRAGFGIITNIQGPGLLDQLRMFGCTGWDERKCNRLIDDWLSVYSGVKRFLDDCKRDVMATGEVRDCWGMPRYLPGVWSDDPRVVAEAARAASSHKIQGGAQGMIQKSMAWLRPRIRQLQLDGFDVRWLLQIHDEIILLLPEWAWDVVNPLVQEALTQHSLKLSVPVKASGSMARTWGAL